MYLVSLQNLGECRLLQWGPRRCHAHQKTKKGRCTQARGLKRQYN